MLIQIILTISALVILVVILVLMKVLKLTRFTYYHNYIADEVLERKEEGSLPGLSTIYASHKLNSPYIKKYIINEDGSDKILLCNFTKPFKKIEYFVFCYNKKQKLKEVLEVKELDTSTTSKVVGLPANTKYVNIVVKEVDGISLNSEIVKPIKRNKLYIASLLNALSVYLILFSLRQLILIIGFYPYVIGFMNESPINIISLVVFLIISLISFVLTLRSLKKRNKKMRTGGVLEYEYF